MANLYGRLQGYNLDLMPAHGEATRIGHGEIVSTVETWQGKVRVELDKEGDFHVFLGSKNGGGKLIAWGNVGDAEEGRWAMASVSRPMDLSLQEGSAVPVYGIFAFPRDEEEIA